LLRDLKEQYQDIFGDSDVHSTKIRFLPNPISGFVPNAVIMRDLQVLSVKQEVRDYSVTYRQRLNDHPNNLAKSLFQSPNYNRRLKWYYPADLPTRFN